MLKERRTQAERSAESRSRLVQAAIRLLSTRGYAKASLVEIGKEAKLSRALVGHHFGSKEACMRSVVSTIREEMTERLFPPNKGKRAPESVLGLLKMLHDDDANARAMLTILVEAVTATPGLRPAVAETNAVIRAGIIESINAELAASASAQKVDVQSLAVVIEGILRGVALQWLADPDSIDLQAVIRMAQSMIRSQIDAPVRLAKKR
ncbi:TetR/AcrR family transcriptional regulator [Bradyrhizobium sp. STM 3566]